MPGSRPGMTMLADFSEFVIAGLDPAIQAGCPVWNSKVDYCSPGQVSPVAASAR